MKAVTWAAVAVTALFALMNLGAVFESEVDTPYRIVGAVLAVVGAGAAAGLGTGQPWGRASVVSVGALNVIASIIGLLVDQEGAVIGIVVGALGVVLGWLSPSESGRATAAAS